MIGHEKKPAPLSMPPEKAAPMGSSAGITAATGDFIRQRADVASANFVEISWERIALWREITRVNRIGIGTAYELDFDHVVGRHHARVARMKLAARPFRLELIEDGVNAVGPINAGPSARLARK